MVATGTMMKMEIIMIKIKIKITKMKQTELMNPRDEPNERDEPKQHNIIFIVI